MVALSFGVSNAFATVANQKVINKGNGTITFVVDENLPAPNDYLYTCNGNFIARNMLNDLSVNNPDKKVVATSFKNDKLVGFPQDAFYQLMISAFAEHRPVKLSPDMIWLLISQQFGHYINENAEEMRDKIVGHQGETDLIVESKKDLLSKDADWEGVINGFASQIKKNTKGDIASTITADFSTTGSVERIASEVTMMKTVKPYFEYIVMRIVCGIPYITLQGTPDDWRKVLDKTMALNKYGLEWWTAGLEPILKEFIYASEGHPNQDFWKNIVKKSRPDEIRGGGCSSETPTVIDGWFLKFFPFNENGRTPETVEVGYKMLPDIMRVGFKYKEIDTSGRIVRETPMELMAGFVGAEEDSATYMLTPKIGWMAVIADTRDSLIQDLSKKAENGWIALKVTEVPSELSQFHHIRHLYLTFKGKVVLPEWMDNMQIDDFNVTGEMSEEEASQLEKRFPNIRITRH